MPKRLYKSTFRVPSDLVQGEGSWVEFRRLTWAEMKPVFETKEHSGWMRAKLSVTAWNWVDEEGNALPNPKEHPEVFDTLPSDEAFFLISASGQGPDAEEEKN